MRSLCAVMIALVFTAGENQWKTVLDKGYVKGYSREVKGKGIHEFRSTAVIPAPIEIVGAVLRNVEGLKDSSTHCTGVRFVEYADKNNYTFYVSYSYPPPVSDRDIVVRVKTRYDLEKGRTVTDMTAVKDPVVPLKRDSIRITDYRAQIVLEYMARDRTGVILTSRLDPGGAIPGFVVNYISRRALDEGVKDLLESVRKKKYHDAAERSGDRALVRRFLSGKDALKLIYTRRMNEFIADREFIALIMEDEASSSRIVDGRMKAGESVVHGWGSFESKCEAVRELIAFYLRLKGFSEREISRKTADRALVASIVKGTGGGSRLKEYSRKKGELNK